MVQFGGKQVFLSADVQYLLRVNGRLGFSCKGNEWFDETSFRYKIQSFQASYERRGSCIGVKSMGARSGCSNELQTK